MTIPSLPVTGADIVAAGVPPGPRVGELLRALEQAWIDDGFVSGRRALIERIAQPTSGGY
jgi:poly(A) polymerase